MNIDDLIQRAAEAAQASGYLTLIVPEKRPPGFPRGELLCVNYIGEKVYSVSAFKILKWAKTNRDERGKLNE